MHNEWLSRTALLLGEERLEKLKSKNVLVVGLGGVGAYAAEMIVRAGVNNITIVDGDEVNESNINRQLPALHSTIGQKKAHLMKNRLLDINPELSIRVIDEYILAIKVDELFTEDYDYVLDAIDTLSPKVFMIQECLHRGLKLVSSMGAGGKTDPTQMHVSSLAESYNCKLACKIRKRLSAMKVSKDFPVVFSSELVSTDATVPVEGERNKKTMVGTISYMPAVFGMFCASVVIRDLIF